MKLIILVTLLINLTACKSESSESEPESEVVVEMECIDTSEYGIRRCTTLEAVCYVYRAGHTGGISCIPKYNLNQQDREDQSDKY